MNGMIWENEETPIMFPSLILQYIVSHYLYMNITMCHFLFAWVFNIHRSMLCSISFLVHKKMIRALLYFSHKFLMGFILVLVHTCVLAFSIFLVKFSHLFDSLQEYVGSQIYDRFQFCNVFTRIA